jgi:hypothetical protein
MDQFEQNAFSDLDAFMQESELNDYPVEINEPDYEDGYGNQYVEEDEPTSPPKHEERTDFISGVLRKYGIDANAIQIQNEEGELEEVSFDDLTDEEKMELFESASAPSINDHELNDLNVLRANRMSLADMIQWQREEAVKEYLAQANTPQYTVDGLSDEDLYVYDLHDRYPEMTDEELEQELDYAKQNQALFEKKMTALRNEYKQLEDEQIAQQKQQASEAKEQEFNMLAQSLVHVANSTNELHDLILEDEDKEAVLSFLLDRDANGQSQFYKLFEDPQKLFELAWYAKFGKQAFADVNDYYKKVIEKTRRGDAPQTKVVKRSADRRSPVDKFDLEGQYANV